jgi:hypothetical protein
MRSCGFHSQTRRRNLRRLLFALLVAGVPLLGAIEATFLQLPATGGRSTVVLSDMHMGVGRAVSGAWHPTEDFRWSSEFAAFLDAVNSEGRGAVDLVLNGDTFELLQSMTAGCEPAPPAGCRADEALTRLERVLSAHSAEIAALARFARAGSNRVVIVPGDHDAALLLPAISGRLMAAIDAPPGRVTTAASGYWVSADGKLYAEHGHQIGFNPHRFEAWPAPFVTIGGIEHVTRSPGELAVQPAYNRLEERYPIVDNFAIVGAGLKYALAADGMPDTGDAAALLLRYFVTLMSWQQFRMELDGGETEPPQWDLAQTRALGPALLVSSLPDDDRFKPTAAKALAEGRLSESLAALSDDELVALCDYRAASRRARRRGEPFLLQFSPRGPIVAECPRTPDSRGALFDYFWRSRDEIFSRRLEMVARQLPSKTAPIVMVHGHTHLPDRGQEGAVTLAAGHLTIPKQGFSPVRGALTPIVINGGAWQRTITPVQYERLESERGLSSGELLRTLQPDDLPPCYGFVQIPPYADVPEPSVRYWRRSATGEWAMAAACGR